MTWLRRSSMIAALSVAAVGATLLATGARADQRIAKDVGPVSGACDSFEKASHAWTACVGAAKAGMPENELFYAGYWLAKSGKYEEALAYLSLANGSDERVQTYIGFATRKLGNVDGALPHYAKALEINPNYTVARAYLGEAYLTRGDAARAKAELSEIASRCGTACAEYRDLEAQIRAFEATVLKG